MSSTYFFIIPLAAVIVVGLIAVAVISRKKAQKTNKKGGTKKGKGKDRATMLREANKRLSQNPRDGEALKILADVNYQDGNFDKAFKTYALLTDLCATNRELDEFEITLRYAISALRCNNKAEAYKSLLIARTMKQDVFEVNYNLGYLEYFRKNFEKAAPLLASSSKLQADHGGALKYLGLSLFRQKKYQESVPHLKRSLDLEPEDKEVLFALGQAYFEMGQQDRAAKILTHLRADPDIGPRAALYAGTLHMKMHQNEEAIMDFEIGLRHENIKEEVMLELKYRLAMIHLKEKNITQAIKQFQEISKVNPKYRDVPEQSAKYGELSLNTHLKTYLIGSVSEFVALCRKLCTSFFPNAKVKIVDISVEKTEYADLLAEVQTARWEDVVLYRYIAHFESNRRLSFT